MSKTKERVTMNTIEAIKVDSSKDEFGNRSTWSYRGHRLRYIQGEGRGYPWTYYPKGTDREHRGCAVRTKSEAIEAIDRLIEQGRLSDLAAHTDTANITT
jgi:hypothetical protein